MFEPGAECVCGKLSRRKSRCACHLFKPCLKVYLLLFLNEKSILTRKKIGEVFLLGLAGRRYEDGFFARGRQVHNTAVAGAAYQHFPGKKHFIQFVGGQI